MKAIVPSEENPLDLLNQSNSNSKSKTPQNQGKSKLGENRRLDKSKMNMNKKGDPKILQNPDIISHGGSQPTQNLFNPRQAPGSKDSSILSQGRVTTQGNLFVDKWGRENKLVKQSQS